MIMSMAMSLLPVCRIQHGWGTVGQSWYERTADEIRFGWTWWNICFCCKRRERLVPISGDISKPWFIFELQKWMRPFYLLQEQGGKLTKKVSMDAEKGDGWLKIANVSLWLCFCNKEKVLDNSHFYLENHFIFLPSATITYAFSLIGVLTKQ